MTTPRRWGPLAAFLAVTLSACGDSDEALDPQIRAPGIGAYQYEAVVQTAADAPADTFEGTLQIAVSSEDSIVGTWDVPGFDDAARGIWNITAYTLPAAPNPPVRGTITHRVWRQAASGNLTCALTYQRISMPADTFRSSSENSCSLVRAGN